MTYLEYTISGFTDNDAVDILVALLNKAGYSGFLESEGELKVYLPAAERNDAFLDGLFNDLEASFGTLKYTCAEIPEVNWNAKWESEFDPVIMGKDVYIRAPFHPEQEGFRYELIIEPKMSFGTGHHETTRLMLTSMLEVDMRGKTVLDMGCGTGVLGIMASKLKCRSVLGIDIDEWACTNSIENAAVNQCQNISIERGDVKSIDDREFHIILANINRNILLQDMTAYSRALFADGILIISGILKQDEEVILKEGYGCGLRSKTITQENNWLSIIFTKEALI